MGRHYSTLAGNPSENISAGAPFGYWHNDVMSAAFDIRTTAGRFRLVALAEAITWIGLLIGMYFKYLGSPRTEIGVKMFGLPHGVLFMAFLVAATLAGIAFSWRPGTWLLALLGSVVPLGSVAFLIWADRTGKLDRPARVASTDRVAADPTR
jgi:integral membrane protein